LLATVCASVIIAAATARLGGYRQMSASVARDNALIGLNVKLPQSFSQTSARMSPSTGACKPALMKHSDTRKTRAVLVPSGSPTGNRFPSTCLMTAGAINSAAGYTTQPMTRSHGMCWLITPVGSTLRTRVPASSPACR